MRAFLRRLWAAFFPPKLIACSHPEQSNIKPGERAYVLYVSIKEYNGNFKEEIHFLNVWTDHEKAQHWQRLLIAEAALIMQNAGIKPLLEENTLISDAPAESVE